MVKVLFIVIPEFKLKVLQREQLGFSENALSVSLKSSKMSLFNLDGLRGLQWRVMKLHPQWPLSRAS